MMPSRGMGAVLPSKMPKAKTGLRKDGDKFSDNGVTKRRKDGDKFTTYAKGGAVKKYQAGGKVDPRVLAAREAESALRNYNNELMFMDRSEIPPPEVQEAQKKELYRRMIEAAPLGFVPDMLPGNSYGFETPKTWKGVEQLRKKGGLIKGKK